MLSERVRVFRGAMVIAALLAACSAKTEPPAAATPASSPAASSAAPAASIVPIGDVSPELTRARETMDPVDLAALAAASGASRLVDLLGDPSNRSVGIAAIGYADDAEVAYARVAAEARAHPGADAVALLDAMARSTERPMRRGELLDSEGVHLAIRDLLAIAGDQGRGAAERAEAATILHRLAARGFLDDATVPAVGP